MTEQRIYGLHAVAAALRYEPEQVQELWVERQRRDGRIQALLDVAATHGTPVRLTERAELDRLSGGARHQGVMARLAIQQRTYSAAGEAEASLYAVDFTLPTVITLGAEDKGLRRLTREVCDRLARIPLATGGVESLNVSVATGIFLFEARRQRGRGW